MVELVWGEDALNGTLFPSEEKTNTTFYFISETGSPVPHKAAALLLSWAALLLS